MALVDAISSLIENANAVCPDRVPAQDEPLTDKVILDIFRKLVENSRIVEVDNRGYLENGLPDADWILGIDSLGDVELLRHIQDDLDNSGGSVFDGFLIFEESICSDDLFDLETVSALPLDLSLIIDLVFDDSSPKDLFDKDFHPNGSMGALAMSLAPFRGHAQEKFLFCSQKSLFTTCAEAPLLSYLAVSLGFPQLDNVFMGAFDRVDEGGVRWFSWADAELFQSEISDYQSVMRHYPNNSELTPSWLVSQVLKSFSMGCENARS